MGNVDPSLCTGTPPPLPGGPGYKGVMETGCRQILGTSDSQPGEKDDQLWLVPQTTGWRLAMSPQITGRVSWSHW